MTLAVLNSRALVGMVALPVNVEVHLGTGLPSFTVVGLADAEVKESRERVRAAIQSSGFEFPNGRITVNLAPADLPKESGRFDLPIALGVLLISGQIDLPELSVTSSKDNFVSRLSQFVFAGELSLTGALMPIRGAITIAMEVSRHPQIRGLIVPRLSAEHASRALLDKVFAADTLKQVVDFLCDRCELSSIALKALPNKQHHGRPCMGEVQGQATARRALEVAATGFHSMLLIGPPGVGKSMLANCLPGILPPLLTTEQVEVAAIASYAESTDLNLADRPFRAPHHSASPAAIVGGGRIPQPGEITLAHHGVLFLDEIPEFDRRTLEALREPLENQQISIARANHKITFPANFQLIATMNPCPCGYRGDSGGRCRCSAQDIRRYQAKLSGPLLDRIDIVVWLPSACREQNRQTPAEKSAVIRPRVQCAHARATQRQGVANARLTGTSLNRYCILDTAAQALIQMLTLRYRLSNRSVARLQRVARTCADLDAATEISTVHLAEAFKYRIENLSHFTQ